MEERAFYELVDMLKVLRGPDGCLWDKEQDHRSLERYVIEEAYEVVEAIERNDFTHLKEELGDLLLQVVFQAQIAEEASLFTIWNVIETLNEKLRRRHPHIFADTTVSSAAEVKRNWERIKEDEKKAHGAETLKAVSNGLPSLLYAYELQDHAGNVGFDWPDTAPVFDKIKEELAELEAEVASGGDIKSEMGDILFAIVNLCRHLKVDPEVALRRTSVEFDRRFEIMERLAADADTTLSELSLDEQDKLWDKAKEIRRTEYSDGDGDG